MTILQKQKQVLQCGDGRRPRERWHLKGLKDDRRPIVFSFFDCSTFISQKAEKYRKMTVPLSFPLPSHQFSEKKTNAKNKEQKTHAMLDALQCGRKKSTIEMNATNASTKSSPKNEKCSPLSLFKRQNATNAYCTQCRTQANAPPWAFLLLADIRTTPPLLIYPNYFQVPLRFFLNCQG